LRDQAARDVASARISNERIVFGLGHASVAEHAVFNFDVLGVSRLAVEALEARRYASFTEKSQRYVKLSRDYLVPDEVKTAGFEGLFRDVADRMFETYGDLLERLADWYLDQGKRKTGTRPCTRQRKTPGTACLWRPWPRSG